jgi:hypothetical protein
MFDFRPVISLELRVTITDEQSDPANFKDLKQGFRQIAPINLLSREQKTKLVATARRE